LPNVPRGTLGKRGVLYFFGGIRGRVVWVPDGLLSPPDELLDEQPTILTTTQASNTTSNTVFFIGFQIRVEDRNGEPGNRHPTPG